MERSPRPQHPACEAGEALRTVRPFRQPEGKSTKSARSMFLWKNGMEMSHWKKIAKKNRKNRALKRQRKPPKEGSCRVTLLGEEPRSVVGGTPLGAPYLSSALADQLLDQLPEQLPGSTIRFEYYPHEFFTFSWELHAPLLVRLARLGARIEFCVNCDGPYAEEFEIKETTVDI